MKKMVYFEDYGMTLVSCIDHADAIMEVRYADGMVTHDMLRMVDVVRDVDGEPEWGSDYGRQFAQVTNDLIRLANDIADFHRKHRAVAVDIRWAPREWQSYAKVERQFPNEKEEDVHGL